MNKLYDLVQWELKERRGPLKVTYTNKANENKKEAMKDDVFCDDNCEFLHPKEREQSQDKEAHICKKFNKPVKHRGYHPKLLKLMECKP